MVGSIPTPGTRRVRLCTVSPMVFMAPGDPDEIPRRRGFPDRTRRTRGKDVCAPRPSATMTGLPTGRMSSGSQPEGDGGSSPPRAAARYDVCMTGDENPGE